MFTNEKKFIVFICILLSLFIGGWIFVTSDFFWGAEREKTIVEIDNNKFKIDCKRSSGRIMVKMFVNSSKKPLFESLYRDRGQFDDIPKIKKIFSDENITAYRSYYEIVYEIDGEFRSFRDTNIPPDEFAERFSKAERKQILKVMDALVSSGDFNSFRYYAETLAYYGNANIKKRINRYAEGNFTDKELNLNLDNSYPKEEVKVFAKSLKEKYNL